MDLTHLTDKEMMTLKAFQTERNRLQEEQFSHAFSENNDTRLFFVNNDVTYTDGQNIIVDPAFGDLFVDKEALKMTEQFLEWPHVLSRNAWTALEFITRAQTLHESLHILYTDFPPPFMTDTICQGINKLSAMSSIFNIIEDTYIEAVGSCIYDNIAHYLKFARVSQLLIKKQITGTVEQKFTKTTKVKTEHGVVIKKEVSEKAKVFCECMSYFSTKFLFPFVKQFPPSVDIKEYVEKTEELFIKGTVAESCTKRYAICREIFMALLPIIPEDDMDESFYALILDEQEQSSPLASKGYATLVQSVQEKLSQLAAGSQGGSSPQTGQTSQQQQAAGKNGDSQSSSSKNGTSQGGATGKNKASQEEAGNQNNISQDAGGKNGDSQGSSSKNGTAQGDASGKNGKSQGEGNQKGDSSTGSSQQNGQNNSTTKGSNKSNPQAQNNSSQQNSAQNQNNPAQQGGHKGKTQAVTRRLFTTLDGKPIVDCGGDTFYVVRDAKSFSKNKKECLRLVEVKSYKIEHKPSSLGAPPTHKGIRVIENHPKVDYTLKKAYQAIYDNYKLNISSYCRKFLQLLKISRASRAGSYSFGFYVESSRLGDPKKRYWQRVQYDDEPPDLSILLLVDGSGSMKGGRRYSALIASVILHEVLKKQGIEHCIAEHRSYGDGTIDVNLLCDFNAKEDEKLNLMQLSSDGCNRDGLALLWAEKHILKNSFCENKLIIVLSDGLPYDWYDDYDIPMSAKDTRDIVRKIMARGTQVIGVALDNDAQESTYENLRPIYPNLVACKDLRKLTGQILAIISKGM